MSKEDLRPLKKAGDPYSDSIRAKVKGSSSDKRKLSAKINSVKRTVNRMSDENFKKYAMEFITDPNVSATEMVRLYNEIKDDENINIKIKTELLGKLVSIHSAIHGNKLTMNGNMNVNVFEKQLEVWRNELKEKRESTEGKEIKVVGYKEEVENGKC